MLLNLMERLSRLMAILGGLVLIALVLLTCVSILGRGLNTLGHSALLSGISESAAQALLASGVGPINGDFELVEAGVAFAIFAFLPLCQLHSGHATVDVFAGSFPRWLNRFLVTFWEVAMTAVVLLIAWRLFAGMEDKMRNGETTFILQFPVWWSYAASLVAAVTAAIVALYCAGARIAELVTGRAILPGSQGAVH